MKKQIAFEPNKRKQKWTLERVTFQSVLDSPFLSLAFSISLPTHNQVIFIIVGLIYRVIDVIFIGGSRWHNKFNMLIKMLKFIGHWPITTMGIYR